MEVNNIDEEKYDSLQLDELFLKDEYSRRFGIIQNNEKKVKLSWRSDIIDPLICKAGSKYNAIGVDNDFILLDVSTLKTIIKLKLNWNLIEILSTEKIIYIVSEQDVLAISLESLGILKSEMLPDAIESCKLIKQELEVLCMDGNSYQI